MDILYNIIQMHHSIFESHLNYCSSIRLSNIKSIIIWKNRLIIDS